MKLTRDLPRFASEIRELITDSELGPPVEDWHPQRVGEIDIRIAADGNWYYQGEKMERLAVVQLFASILRLDEDGYCLVTPAEKMKIQVDDVPFLVNMVDVDRSGSDQVINFSTSLGECFSLGPDHPLEMLPSDGGSSRPYVVVKRNLKGLLSRNVYYELADVAESSEEGSDMVGVRSHGAFYALG